VRGKELLDPPNAVLSQAPIAGQVNR